MRRAKKHSTPSLVGLFTVATIASVTAAGCRGGNQNSQAGPPPASQPRIVERQLPPRAQPMLIKQGRLPLAYLVEASATLRFVDLTSGVELARALVQPRQVASVDENRGVRLGPTVLRPGPLSADHEYGIWLDPEVAGGEIRTTVAAPARPVPATLPAEPSTQPRSLESR